MHLTLSGYGLFLGLKGRRLVVKRRDEKDEFHSLMDLESVLVIGRGVSFSSDLLSAMVSRGVPVTFANPRGDPYAMLSAAGLHATVKTRRAQLLAYEDERGVEFARTIVAGKLRNQVALIRYFAKNRDDDEEASKVLAGYADELSAYIDKAKGVCGDRVDDVRNELMINEAHAGKIYWRAVRHLLGPESGFTGRRRRPARDPVNAALNYAYGILYSRIWRAVLLAGLEPYAGFLHSDRPGKPSLVLDLVEEFRQPLADRPVLTIFTSGGSLNLDERHLLDDKSRDKVVERVNKRFDAKVQFRGKKLRLESIVQQQVRSLAMYFRGGKPYKPYPFKW